MTEEIGSAGSENPDNNKGELLPNVITDAKDIKLSFSDGIVCACVTSTIVIHDYDDLGGYA